MKRCNRIIELSSCFYSFAPFFVVFLSLGVSATIGNGEVNREREENKKSFRLLWIATVAQQKRTGIKCK